MVISEKKNIKIQAQKWKGNWKIHIRQWYEKDGEELPGKGITLSVEEWAKFIENFELIKEEINSHIRS